MESARGGPQQTVLCMEHQRITFELLRANNAPQEHYDAIVLTYNEDQCELCAARERATLADSQATFAASKRKHKGREVPKGNIETGRAARYGAAGETVFMRVTVEVYDAKQRVLDRSSRVYEHDPTFAAEQYEQITTALGHNKPEGS